MEEEPEFKLLKLEFKESLNEVTEEKKTKILEYK